MSRLSCSGTESRRAGITLFAKQPPTYQHNLATTPALDPSSAVDLDPVNLPYPQPQPQAQTSRPPPPPFAWLWRCHHCHVVYRLGCTRRCLECSHDFCSSNDMVDGHGRTTAAVRAAKRQRRHRGGPCKAEFDYVGWAVWGAWRRSVLATQEDAAGVMSTMCSPRRDLLAELDTFALYRSGTADDEEEYLLTPLLSLQWGLVSDSRALDVARRKESMYIARKHDCWVHCDFPSECHHAIYAARIAGRTKSTAGIKGLASRGDVEPTSPPSVDVTVPAPAAGQDMTPGKTKEAGVVAPISKILKRVEFTVEVSEPGVPLPPETSTTAVVAVPVALEAASAIEAGDETSPTSRVPVMPARHRRQASQHTISQHKIAQLTGLELDIFDPLRAPGMGVKRPHSSAGRSLTHADHPSHHGANNVAEGLYDTPQVMDEMDVTDTVDEEDALLDDHNELNTLLKMRSAFMRGQFMIQGKIGKTSLQRLNYKM
ncbi:hypothetical protein P8C59_000026 [Phyllachora maydis]|uniref:Uncharacterized protein n=1 Tax=Phyllachora maydis TaxID=1825666 RepID=A0AAD9HV75_9PEZI|nr:hypothetical protein P8C59_000026 [Phyllachora maydis]